jgi:N-formylmaleamate deformylase
MAKLYYGHAQVDQVKIQYYRTVEGKPPIVFLHGITDNGLCWGRIALALEYAYDVILLDSRGHGLSDAPGDGYSNDILEADVAGVIETLELKKPVLIGHSMGAHTAATVAANYPELVSRVILEDPPFWGDPQHESLESRAEVAQGWIKNIQEQRSMSIDELVSICKQENPGWHEEDLLQCARASQQVKPEVALWMTAERKPWREITRLISCPVLCITADPELGAIITPEVAEEMVQINRKITIAHIPGAGHSIRRDQYDQYLALIKDFLRKKA